MKQLEQRLRKLEKMHSIKEHPDPETMREVMKSQMFGLHCFLKRKSLGRDLTSDERLEIAIDLFRSGKWRESVVDKIVESLRVNCDNIID